MTAPYEIECDLDIDPGARGGLLLFYDHRLYCVLPIGDKEIQTHKHGVARNRSPIGSGKTGGLAPAQLTRVLDREIINLLNGSTSIKTISF